MNARTRQSFIAWSDLLPSQHTSQLFYGLGVCLSHGFFYLLFLAVEEKSVGRDGLRLKKGMDASEQRECAVCEAHKMAKPYF